MNDDLRIEFAEWCNELDNIEQDYFMKLYVREVKPSYMDYGELSEWLFQKWRKVNG